MSPELQAAINEFRASIEQTKADISEWKSRESTKLDLLANRFEKMDLLGNPNAGLSEEHGGEFWALPFANKIPGVEYAGPQAHQSWRAHLAQGSTADLRAALSVGSDANGGVLVPAFVSSRIDSIAFEFSPVRQFARIETTIGAYVRIALLTGMRSGEIRTLQWGRVDFAKRTVTVGKAKTAAGTGRVIPMSPELFDVLTRHAEWFTGRFGETKPEYYLFPFGEKWPNDPTQPTLSVKKAWDSVRRASLAASTICATRPSPRWLRRASPRML